MYVEKYYDLSEEDMQTLINRGKAGDQAAQLELLDVFDNFLKKYIAILHENKINLGDYDVRRFVCLFIGDKRLRTAVSRNKANRYQVFEVKNLMEGIQYMVLRYGTFEDIKQTVEMTFLSCVDKYERKESKQGGWVPFSGFLYSYFFYVLKKNVEIMLIDQLGRKTFPLITDEQASEPMSSGNKEPGFPAPPEPGVEEVAFTEDLTDMWVAGKDCQFPFSELTVQDRQLLKWKYSNGDKTSEIADRLSEHPNTVRERLKSIQVRLEEVLAS